LSNLNFFDKIIKKVNMAVYLSRIANSTSLRQMIGSESLFQSIRRNSYLFYQCSRVIWYGPDIWNHIPPDINSMEELLNLDCGADFYINEALTLAINRIKNLAMVQRLLERGADFNADHNLDWIVDALKVNPVNLETIQLFHSRGFPVNRVNFEIDLGSSGNTPGGAESYDEALTFATNRIKNLATVQRLLEHGARFNEFNEDRDLGWIVDALGAHPMNLETIQLFLSHGLPVDTRNSESETLLFKAVKSRDFKTIRLLLDHSASIYPISHSGKSPLSFALDQQDETTISLFIDNGFSGNRPDRHGITLIQKLAKEGNLPMANLLLAREKDPFWFDPMTLDKQDETTVNFFIDHGFSGNRPDRQGITLIHRLAAQGNVPIVRLLLSRERNPILINPNGYFTDSILEACRVPSQIAILEQIPDEGLATPLIVCQNNCDTIVQLANGNLLTLKNTDAESAYSYLQTRRNPAWQPDHHSLTIYPRPGHAFARLTCPSCESGVDKSFGFYPASMPLSLTQEGEHSKSKIIERIKRNIGRVSRISKSVQFAIPQEKRATFRDAFRMLKDQKGTIQDEQIAESDAKKANHPRLTFHIGPDQAQAIWKHKKNVEASCFAGQCRYNVLDRNCVSFAQELFAGMNASGHFGDFLTHEQLLLGGWTYENKALAYTYMKSRVPIDYADSLMTTADNVAFVLVLYKISKSLISWFGSFLRREPSSPPTAPGEDHPAQTEIKSKYTVELHPKIA
jgi:ankyrin repeat protein